MNHKYQTEETTLKAITHNKKDECVAAVTRLFHDARKQGNGLMESVVYAESFHYLYDHDGVQSINFELEFNHPDATDDEIKSDLRQYLIETNVQGDALEEQSTIFNKWYDLLRSWGMTQKEASFFGTDAANEELGFLHDFTDEEARKELDDLLSEIDADLHEFAVVEFTTRRELGETNRSSLRWAITKLQEALEQQRSSLVGFMKVIRELSKNNDKSRLN